MKHADHPSYRLLLYVCSALGQDPDEALFNPGGLIEKEYTPEQYADCAKALEQSYVFTEGASLDDHRRAGRGVLMPFVRLCEDAVSRANKVIRVTTKYQVAGSGDGGKSLPSVLSNLLLQDYNACLDSSIVDLIVWLHLGGVEAEMRSWQK